MQLPGGWGGRTYCASTFSECLRISQASAVSDSGLKCIWIWFDGALELLLSCCLLFSLKDTGMTQKGKDLLAEVSKTREKLDVNFLHHAQVMQKRNATNVAWSPVISSFHVDIILVMNSDMLLCLSINISGIYNISYLILSCLNPVGSCMQRART